MFKKLFQFRPSSRVLSRNDKYEILSKAHPLNPDLHLIRAVRTVKVGEDIRAYAGDLGGYVTGDHNLSSKGGSWITPGSFVKDNAFIGDDALITENSKLRGVARAIGNAFIEQSELKDRVVVEGHAKVLSCYLKGSVLLQNYAVARNSDMWGNATVSDHADVSYSVLCDDTKVSGEAFLNYVELFDNVEISGLANLTGSPGVRMINLQGDTKIDGKVFLYPGTVTGQSMSKTPIQIAGLRWPVTITEKGIEINGRLFNPRKITAITEAELEEIPDKHMRKFILSHKEKLAALSEINGYRTVPS